MGKSNAERQRAYRARHSNDLDSNQEPLERINHLVKHSTKNQLKRLAFCYGVTQKALLEQIIQEAQERLLNTLDPQQQTDYYDMRKPLRSNN